ncbi:MAG: NADH-quinone oxidoreductase subunit C [Gammaproteobacteria bacterium]|nr:NADH-quinone oxidoreductase subunit C [Gammaproteobacteria bacterium]
MSKSLQQLQESLRGVFADKLISLTESVGEVTIEVSAENLVEVANELRDNEQFKFQQLVDLCGVDYSQYGETEWQTDDASRAGFSRGVEGGASMGRLQFGDELESVVAEGRRYAMVCHLVSYRHNRRLRLRCFAADDSFPVVPSLVNTWRVADWYEREAFDLFGILFSDHPDLRRILTDYGFVGHPFRKDFPLVGHVEMRYDPEKERVVYEPVSIEPRVLVPRVKREDHRYLSDEAEDNA